MNKVSPALTSVQQQQLGEIESSVQNLFHEIAERWARSTGFVQRCSKISGSAFAQTLVFGFLNQPEASYTDLQQTMELQGVHASPQAIEERMTPEAAALMGRLLEEMVAMVVSGQECHIPVLHSFSGVYLQDGTILSQMHCESGGVARARGEEKQDCVYNCASIGKMDNSPVPGCKMLARVKTQGRLPSKTRRCPRERSMWPIAAI